MSDDAANEIERLRAEVEAGVVERRWSVPVDRTGRRIEWKLK